MNKEIKSMTIVLNDFIEEDIEKEMLRAEDGNIQAKLNLIMHNQAVLNEKLDHPIKTMNEFVREEKEQLQNEEEECSRCNQKLKDVTIRRIENIKSHNNKLCGKWCDEYYKMLGGIIK